MSISDPGARTHRPRGSIQKGNFYHLQKGKDQKHEVLNNIKSIPYMRAPL